MTKANIASLDMTLDDQVKVMQVKLRTIAKSFIEIGMMLDNIQNMDTFRDKGYVSIAAFAQAELGLSKNQTYNLINVSRSFTYAGQIQERYKEFSFSQLVEMVSLPEELHEEIKPEMKVVEIREIKKTVKKEKNVSPDIGTDNESALDPVEVIVQKAEKKETPSVVSAVDNLINEVLYKETLDEVVKYLNDTFNYYKTNKKRFGINEFETVVTLVNNKVNPKRRSR